MIVITPAEMAALRVEIFKTVIAAFAAGVLVGVVATIIVMEVRSC